MPVYQLPEALIFPDPELANPDGIIALGGDLSAERILLAYENGIFPWFSSNEPILWWSPNPRMVLYPAKVKVSKSMKQVLRSNKFSCTFDQDFETVIRSCAKTRPKQDNVWAWLTEEMIQAYLRLHQLGFAHSVEVWQNNEIVGGLYGVSLGGVYFGESMFSKVSNSSKVGFITLVRKLEALNFGLIDCQVHTNHLESLGAEEITRTAFLAELEDELQKPTFRGSWEKL